MSPWIRYLLICSIGFANKALAFDSIPAIKDFKTEELNTNISTEISSEYGGDLLNFSSGISEYIKGQQSTKYFNTQVGSLSGDEFHQEKNFRLQENIHKNHSLEVRYHQKQNFHINQEIFLLSWLANINKNWSVGLFGDFEHEKKYNDIGYHLQYRKKESRHRLSHYFPNYSLNKRNAGTDTYKKGYFPQVLGYQYQKQTETDFLDLVLRLGKESLWKFPDDSKQFRQKSLYFHFIHSEKNAKTFKNQWGLTARYNSIDEEDLSENLNARKIQRSFKIHYQRMFIDRMEHQVAGGFEYRRISFENLNQKAPLHYFTPFVRWKNINSNWKHQLVLNHFHSQEDRDLLGFTDSFEKHLIYAAEYKIPLKKNLDWVFGLSIDVDRFGSDDTWEGGYSKMFWNF